MGSPAGGVEIPARHIEARLLVVELHGYLLGRADQQLRDFAAVGSRSLSGTRPPRPPRAGQPRQPFQFLIEIISSRGHVSAIEAPPHHGALPQISAGRLGIPDNRSPRPPQVTPGTPGASWSGPCPAGGTPSSLTAWTT